MRIILSEATQTACSVFWTAGQRIDPTTNTTFVWRLTSTDTHSDTVSVMRYSNWDQGQPNNHMGVLEGCIRLARVYSYKWHDSSCNEAYCSVCELDTI